MVGPSLYPLRGYCTTRSIPIPIPSFVSLSAERLEPHIPSVQLAKAPRPLHAPSGIPPSLLPHDPTTRVPSSPAPPAAVARELGEGARRLPRFPPRLTLERHQRVPNPLSCPHHRSVDRLLNPLPSPSPVISVRRSPHGSGDVGGSSSCWLGGALAGELAWRASDLLPTNAGVPWHGNNRSLQLIRGPSSKASNGTGTLMSMEGPIRCLPVMQARLLAALLNNSLIKSGQLGTEFLGFEIADIEEQNG